MTFHPEITTGIRFLSSLSLVSASTDPGLEGMALFPHLTTTHQSPLSSSARMGQCPAPNDDLLADDLLKHRRPKAVQDWQHDGGLICAFSSNSKSWDSAEIFNALGNDVERINRF